MNWNGLQVERLAMWRFSKGVVATVLRFIIFGIGITAAVALVLTPYFEAPRLLVAFYLLAVTASLIVWSWFTYVNYIFHHQDYLINEALKKENYLNACDLATLEVLAKVRRKPDLSKILIALTEQNESRIAAYRLGITTELLNSIKLEAGNFVTDLSSGLTQLSQKAMAENRLISVFELFDFVLGLPNSVTLLNQLGLSREQVTKILEYYQSQESSRRRLRSEHLIGNGRTGGFAASWATSYTNLLDSFTQEVPPAVKHRNDFVPIYSRASLIKDIVTELSKSKGQNVLLVGEPGVGRQELFLHLAGSILNYQTSTQLDGSMVRILDVERLLAAAPNPTQLQPLFDALCQELVKAGRVILFISNIDLLLDPSTEIGSANIGNLLENYLADERVKIIGSLDTTSYVEKVKNNSLLRSHFSVVEIAEPSGDELADVLLSHIPIIENRYQVFFLYIAIIELIKLTSRYLKGIASPSRELDVLEEVASVVHSKSSSLVTVEDIRAVVGKIAKVPIASTEEQKQTVLNVESSIHQRVVGQDRAIKQISDALLRSRAGLTIGSRPIGTFLFLGPTGVGKTETAKTLAKVYFGSQEFLTRLDMTEYADELGLQKLLGESTTNPGSLTIAIQNHPSCVLLLDEIEKASTQTINVMLPLLDEGRLTTNFGKVLDFTNSIVIATSNAGSDFIKAQISKGNTTSSFEKQLIDKLISERIFTPEFLNRFDAVVVYSPLTTAEIKKVVEIRLNELRNRLKADKNFDLEISPVVIDSLTEMGYDPVFGARALDRVIREKLETAIAREIVTQQPAAGSKLVVKSI